MGITMYIVDAKKSQIRIGAELVELYVFMGSEL